MKKQWICTVVLILSMCAITSTFVEGCGNPNYYRESPNNSREAETSVDAEDPERTESNLTESSTISEGVMKE